MRRPDRADRRGHHRRRWPRPESFSAEWKRTYRAAIACGARVGLAGSTTPAAQTTRLSLDHIVRATGQTKLPTEGQSETVSPS